MPGRSVRVAVAAVVAAGALAGCGGSQKPGSAALVGDDRITVTKLSQTVRDWREQFRADPAANELRAGAGNPVRQLAGDSESDLRGALTMMINFRVGREVAERAGVKVTEAQVDAAVRLLDQETNQKLQRPPGTPGGAVSTTLDSGLPRAYTRDLARLVATQILVTQAGRPFVELFPAAAHGLDIEVNPRYGTYDPAKLELGPVRSRLSSPDSGI